MSEPSATDQELLREFIQARSEAAFAELVRRHADWIYSVAHRRAGEAAADDLTQAVFLVLVQKAEVASRQRVLSAWLFGVLRFAVLRWRRDQARRARHEMRAGQIRPIDSHGQMDTEALAIIDTLLAELREKDRRAILVRFYEQRSLTETAAILGISENATRKRLERAIHKLRDRFTARGIRTGAEFFTPAMVQQLVMPASPKIVALAASLARLRPTSLAIELSKGAIHMMFLKKVGLVAACSLAICIGIGGMVAAYALCAGRTDKARSVPSLPQQVFTLQSQHTLAAVSRDGRVSGYSNMLGKWTPLDLPPDAAAEMKQRAQSNQFDGMVESNDVLVFTIHGHVYGYSPALGTWAEAPLDAAAQAAIADGNQVGPVVSENIAAVLAGNHVYGYSPLTGTWDAMLIDADAGANAFSTMRDMAMVNYGDHLAIFSVHTGKWAPAVWKK